MGQFNDQETARFQSDPFVIQTYETASQLDFKVPYAKEPLQQNENKAI